MQFQYGLDENGEGVIARIPQPKVEDAPKIFRRMVAPRGAIVEADSWVAAKQALGFELTPTQKAMLAG